jgi:hypothetical protein
MAPPCRAPVSPKLRFGFAGAKPKLGVRWVAHFQLILLRVRFGFAPPRNMAGQASSPQEVFTNKKQKFLTRGSSAMPQLTREKLNGAAYQASPAQCFKANGQNFGWGQNFASNETGL